MAGEAGVVAVVMGEGDSQPAKLPTSGGSRWALSTVHGVYFSTEPWQQIERHIAEHTLISVADGNGHKSMLNPQAVVRVWKWED